MDCQICHYELGLNYSNFLFSRVTFLLCFTAFSALTLLVGRQEEQLARKKLSDGTGVVICLECGANDLLMVQLMPLPPIISCFSKTQNGLPFWCRLTQVVLEKMPLNVCVFYWLVIRLITSVL